MGIGGNGVTGHCLEVNDLANSKYVAGRRKDLEFNKELARHKMIDCNTLKRRLNKTDVSRPERTKIKLRIEATFGSE